MREETEAFMHLGWELVSKSKREKAEKRLEEEKCLPRVVKGQDLTPVSRQNEEGLLPGEIRIEKDWRA